MAAVIDAQGARTDAQFAAAIGTSVDSVQRWRRGDAVPRSQAVIQNLEAEGVPASLIRKARQEKAKRAAA